jgi:hypothetical protein
MTALEREFIETAEIDAAFAAYDGVKARDGWAEAVEAMLIGIRRELDAWPADREHRCYSRGVTAEELGALSHKGGVFEYCACGKPPMCSVYDIAIDLRERAARLFYEATERRWVHERFGGRSISTPYLNARPGTRLERMRPEGGG